MSNDTTTTARTNSTISDAGPDAGPATGPAGAPELGDPRPEFARAVATARTVVAGIGLDQFDLPTPCPEFDVRTLTGHLVGVLHRVAVIGRGGDPFEMPEFDRPDDSHWLASFDECAAEVEDVWGDDAVLTTLLTLPWTQLPGAIALTIYVNEVSVHTWDLATATGQSPAWDDSVLQLAYDGIVRGLPAENRAGQYDEAEQAMDPEHREFVPPFADVVPVPEDAPLIDRLVAWNGRRP